MFDKFRSSVSISLAALFVCFLVSQPNLAQQADASKKSLEELFKSYILKDKEVCGKRDEQIRLAKKILAEHGGDELNREVIAYVRKSLAEMEKQEPICRRNFRYDEAFKSKNWTEFFAISKEIIADEGDSPLALDIMLTLVSVGYDRLVVDQDDSFVNDTLLYAQLALQLIESGKIPTLRMSLPTKNLAPQYGIFLPFKSKDKALKWMNYILGYIHYNKLKINFGARREGLGYFYKALQYAGDNGLNADIYEIFGGHYFEQAASSTLASKIENEETKALERLQKDYVERAIDAYARARKSYNGDRAEILPAFYQKITDLYRFRFNLAPTDTPDGLDEFVKKLISQPLPDPLTLPTTLSEDPIEIRLKGSKRQ